MGRPLAEIAVTLLVAAATCGGARAEVIVAVPAPLSGRHQATGEAVRAGAEQAIAAINAAGGLLGERVAVAVEDDGCDSAKGAAVATSLAERKPAAVIGHPCSGAAVAAAPVYAAANIVFIAPGVRHPALTAQRGGPTVFRLAGRDDRQGEAAAQWLAGVAPNQRISLIHDRTVYARALAEDAARSLKTSGVGGVPMLAIVAGGKDYGAIVQKLIEARTETVFFAGYPAEARVILDDLRRAGSAARFLGSDSLATAEFTDVAGADPERVCVLLAREAEIGALTHGAVEAWAAAVRQANSFESKDVSGALARTSMQTSALGPVSFDENGDARIVSFAPAVWNGTGWKPRD